MRPILFTVLFYGWTSLLGVLVLPFLLGPPRLLLAYSRFWVRGSLWILRMTIGVTHEVRGAENIPEGPALFAIKHQSAWDTLAINLIVHDTTSCLSANSHGSRSSDGVCCARTMCPSTGPAGCQLCAA